jgi:pimeloyl-ACP methyl ester carboxylesterase
MSSKRTPILSRRTLIKGSIALAGAAVGCSLPAVGAEAANGTPPTGGSIESSEYWAQNGQTRLYLFRKRIKVPSNTFQPVLFLAHGSSISALPSYDLQVPGSREEFSMMDVFARSGFDVWVVDFEGYGKSSQTGGNSDIARGAENIRLAVKRIKQETVQDKFHFYGESSGALRVGAYAMLQPENVLTLNLVSLSYTGEGSPTLSKRKEMIPYLESHDRRPRDREMIRSIFTRDRPGTYDPAVPEALADMELKLTDSVPTGTYLDMTTKLPLLDPTKVAYPLLVIRGEYDGIATEEDVLNYFRNATTKNRQYCLIPGATHAIGWGNQRKKSWYTLRAFLQSPA